jgi:hypothetical protein
VGENPAGEKNGGRRENSEDLAHGETKQEKTPSDFGREGRERQTYYANNNCEDNASSERSTHPGDGRLEIVVQAYRDVLPDGAVDVSHRSLFTRLCEITGLANQAVGALIASALAARVLLRVSPLVYRLAGLP